MWTAAPIGRITTAATRSLGDRGRGRDAEQQDQHRRHQRPAAGTGHADQQADDRAAEDDVGIDVHVPLSCALLELRRRSRRRRRRPVAGGSPESSHPSSTARTRPRLPSSDSALVTVGRRAATRSESTAWVSRSGTTTPSRGPGPSARRDARAACAAARRRGPDGRSPCSPPAGASARPRARTGVRRAPGSGRAGARTVRRAAPVGPARGPASRWSGSASTRPAATERRRTSPSPSSSAPKRRIDPDPMEEHSLEQQQPEAVVQSNGGGVAKRRRRAGSRARRACRSPASAEPGRSPRRALDLLAAGSKVDGESDVALTFPTLSEPSAAQRVPVR